MAPLSRLSLQAATSAQRSRRSSLTRRARRVALAFAALLLSLMASQGAPGDAAARLGDFGFLRALSRAQLDASPGSMRPVRTLSFVEQLPPAVRTTVAVTHEVAPTPASPGAVLPVGNTDLPKGPLDAHGRFAPQELDRVKMRVDGLGTYAVVSALVVNMGIRLVSAISEDALRRIWLPLGCFYCGSLALCVLSGVYATVVFTLTKMYSKTAMGLHRDAAFIEFFKSTAIYRQLGFVAFCTSLACFAFAFVTSFLIRVRGMQGLAGFCVGSVVVWKGMVDFYGIYARAGKAFG